MENRTMNDVSLASRTSVALSFLLHPLFIVLLFVEFLIVHVGSDHRCICEMTGLVLGPLFATLIAVVVFALLWLISHGIKRDGWFIREQVARGLRLQGTLLIWWLVALFFLALYVYVFGTIFVVSFLFRIYPVLIVTIVCVLYGQIVLFGVWLIAGA